MNTISIQIIAENTCIRDNILAQHGISMLIHYNWKKYLFDCGQIKEWLLYNMKSMNIDIKRIDWIIISHDHQDHCGSLPGIISKFKKQAIYITPDFQTKKYSYKNFVYIKKATEIEKNMFLIWPLSSKNNCQEQSIAIDLWKKWLVIIVGCSHPWIKNIVSAAQKTTGNKKIMWIIWGLHFIEMSNKEINKQITYLSSLKTQWIIPGHCTGSRAIEEMKKQLWNIVKTSLIGWIWAGSKIEITPKLNFDLNR